MRSFKREWLPSVLAVLLAFCAFLGCMPLSAYAQKADNTTYSSQPVKITKLENGINEVTGCFALTTVINGHTWALCPNDYQCRLYRYDPNDITQMWCIDNNGTLQCLVSTLYDKGAFPSDLQLEFQHSNTYESGWLNVRNAEYAVNGKPDSWCYGDIPLTFDGRYLAINDYKNKLSSITMHANDHVTIGLNDYDWTTEPESYEKNQTIQVGVYGIFDEPKQCHELSFQKVETTVRYRRFIEYELEKDDWTITYNDDGSYNVEICGRLNVPLLDGDESFASVWCGTKQCAEVEMKPGEQEFTILAKGLPDTQEAHFWFVIQQHFWGKVGGTYWQYYEPWTFPDYEQSALWELHEESVSFPVQKIWADGKEKHSGDIVDLNLRENGSKTSYNVELSEENDWQGAFKHVPYVRWTYPAVRRPIPVDNTDTSMSVADTPMSIADMRAAETPWSDREGTEIPLDPRGKYTVVETSDTPGYIASYEFTEPAKPGKPKWVKTGSSPAVQVVFESADGSLNAIDFQDGTIECREYKQGKDSQQFVLNGDHTLVCKIGDLSGSSYPGYAMINFEKANEDGKYHLYQTDPQSGKKWYLCLSADSRITGTEDKRAATAVTFRNFKTGKTLNELPKGSFQPVEKVLQVYMNGKATNKVIDLDNYGFGMYDPNNPYQKFTVCCYNGQLVACSCIPDPSGSLLLEPCKGASGEYFLRTFYPDGHDKWTLVYLGVKNGRPAPVQDEKDALHVVLADSASFGGNLGVGYFTVTNTPVKTPTLPKTGDSSNLALCLGLLAISTAGLVALRFTKRRFDEV